MGPKIIVIVEKKDIAEFKKGFSKAFPDFKMQKTLIFISAGDKSSLESLLSSSKEEFLLITGCKSLLPKHFLFKNVSFGFSEEADFFATDRNISDQGINFKLNYRGNSVPVWLKSQQDNKVAIALCIFCVGDVLGKSVIEISERVKDI